VANREVQPSEAVPTKSTHSLAVKSRPPTPPSFREPCGGVARSPQTLTSRCRTPASS